MKAIIFDMDGVLFDTERVGDQAWRQAAEEMGFAQIDDCLLYTSPSPRDYAASRMPSSA